MNKIREENSAFDAQKGRGRPKGAVNKTTKAFRETVNDLLEGNSGNISKWLQMVADGDGDQLKPDPKGALDVLSKLAEFATPKLARTEHTGTNDKPIEMKITWMK